MVQFAPESLQIICRTLSKHPIQYGVVRIVTGTDAQKLDGCVLTNPVHYVSLSTGKVRGIGTHVVKQDRQFVNADTFQQRELVCQRRAGLVVEPVEYLERAQPYAKTHPLVTTETGKLGQLRGHSWRVWLLPFSPEEGIGLGSIEIKAVTVGSQGADQVSTFLPGPHGAVESFNDA
jgi:hypothetical protein